MRSWREGAVAQINKADRKLRWFGWEWVGSRIAVLDIVSLIWWSEWAEHLRRDEEGWPVTVWHP